MQDCHFFPSPLLLSVEGTRPGPGLGSRSGLALVKFTFTGMPASIVRSSPLLTKYKNESQRMYLEEEVDYMRIAISGMIAGVTVLLLVVTVCFQSLPFHISFLSSCSDPISRSFPGRNFLSYAIIIASLELFPGLTWSLHLP